MQFNESASNLVSAYEFFACPCVNQSKHPGNVILQKNVGRFKSTPHNVCKTLYNKCEPLLQLYFFSGFFFFFPKGTFAFKLLNLDFFFL